LILQLGGWPVHLGKMLQRDALVVAVITETTYLKFLLDLEDFTRAGFDVRLPFYENTSRDCCLDFSEFGDLETGLVCRRRARANLAVVHPWWP